jgi:hypothetical protein
LVRCIIVVVVVVVVAAIVVVFVVGVVVVAIAAGVQRASTKLSAFVVGRGNVGIVFEIDLTPNNWSVQNKRCRINETNIFFVVCHVKMLAFDKNFVTQRLGRWKFSLMLLSIPNNVIGVS